jgi:heat-inducible transcriptional repressor
MLKEKQRQKRLDQVLKSLVTIYIDTGEPVSSGDVAHETNIGLSSATIRTAMATLDEKRLTSQPHSSAGRIPTDRGVRRYIDLMRETDFSQKNFKSKLDKTVTSLGNSELDIGAVLQQAASFIAETAHGVGVVVSPRFGHDFIRKVQLIMIDPQRMLAVIVSEIGLIKSQIMSVDRKLSYFNLRRIEEYINARLGGKENLARFGPDYFTEDEKQIAEKSSQEIFLKYIVDSPAHGGELFIEGFSNLLNCPEFSHQKDAYSAIRFFEEKEELLKIFSHDQLDSHTKTLIGREISENSGACGLSIMLAPYKLNSINIGVIGAVTPMRTLYSEIIPLIEQAGGWLTEVFSNKYNKPKIGYDKDLPFKVIVG